LNENVGLCGIESLCGNDGLCGNTNDSLCGTSLESPCGNAQQSLSPLNGDSWMQTKHMKATRYANCSIQNMEMTASKSSMQKLQMTAKHDMKQERVTGTYSHDMPDACAGRPGHIQANCPLYRERLRAQAPAAPVPAARAAPVPAAHAVPDRPRLLCSVCQKPGHTASRCWIANPELHPSFQAGLLAAAKENDG
jgi:hypothetical protein